MCGEIFVGWREVELFNALWIVVSLGLACKVQTNVQCCRSCSFIFTTGRVLYLRARSIFHRKRRKSFDGLQWHVRSQVCVHNLLGKICGTQCLSPFKHNHRSPMLLECLKS